MGHMNGEFEVDYQFFLESALKAACDHEQMIRAFLLGSLLDKEEQAHRHYCAMEAALRQASIAEKALLELNESSL